MNNMSGWCLKLFKFQNVQTSAFTKMSVLKAKNAKDNCERDLKLYQQRPEMIIYTSQLVV